ncbi:MAG: hypothetical protein ACREII_08115 [Nitrospiraceae bacterium]
MLATFVFLCPAQPGLAGPESVSGNAPDFPGVLRAQAGKLASVTTDAEALTLFSSHLASALSLQDSVTALPGKPLTGKTSSDRLPNPELTASAVRLTAELAAWRLATAMKEAADAAAAPALQTVLHQASIQQSWLLQEDRGRQPLRRAVKLASVLTSIEAPEAPPTSEPAALAAYGEYAEYLDRTYPGLTEADTSWLAVAEREGASGLRRRMMEFWENRARSDGDKDALVARYFQTRLRPVLTAQVAALAIRAEAEAEQHARDEWMRLRTWRDRLNETKGLARLCGTWQWTVHNHTNHQEHKMLMVFPSPETPDPNQPTGPRPVKIVVLGDAVFLRWEFQMGYQEDSLLFIKDGQRLEGSFINSAGAWGSITGKRTGSCPR